MLTLIKNIISLFIRTERSVDTIVSPLTKIVRELKEHAAKELDLAQTEAAKAEALALKADGRRDEAHKADKTAVNLDSFFASN